ncbi:MAG: VCBS repeat-containing protein, partial [Terrimicrobiaceae bacterium]|nr:VCBS repeat-containing protein [Terrimicrobiaceae bacterium]
GSYSANNIHLLVNSGSGTRPVFEEANRHILAFGDGLEQLSPAVVDYNGDGLPDLLVTERSGKIALYLNKGQAWKAGEPVPELPFASFVNTGAGSPITLGGIATVAVGDLDGNGLFDIIAGKSNGRVAVAFNKGTKQEPKFDPPVELKGEAGTPAMNLPSGWEVDFGLERGNFLAYANVVKDSEDPNLQPAEGKAAAKFGYSPSHNRVMPPPSYYSPGFGTFNPEQASLSDAPARVFSIRQAGRFRLNNGSSYTFSMKSRGRAADGTVVIRYVGERELAPERITRGDRDAVTRQRQTAREEKRETVKFSPGPAWTTTTKDFRVTFANKDLNPNDLKQTNTAELQITFTVPPGGELFLDDVSLMEKL